MCICVLTSTQKCTSPSCWAGFRAMASTSPSELVHPHYLYAAEVWSFVLHNWTKCLDYSSGTIWYQNVHVKVAHLRPLVPVRHFQRKKKKVLNLVVILWFQPSRRGGRECSNSSADRWCIYFQIKLCERNTYWIVLPFKIWHFTKHINQKVPWSIATKTIADYKIRQIYV